MKRYRIAFRVGLATTVATFCLIVLGGVVFNTGSSLACPDWPKCFDQWMPPMVGGVIYEHGHRLLGAFIGLSSILLCVLLWQKEPRSPAIRGMGAALPVLILFQGVLGGLVVIYRLPTMIRAGHLATSMLVLMTLIYLSRASWFRARGAEPTLAGTPGVRAAFSLLALTTAMVYLQLILGALVRHTNASEAAGWGLAGAMIGIDPLTGKNALWPGDEAAQLNVFHRYVALGVASVVIVCCARCWALLRERLGGWETMLIWLPVGLVLLQIGVGIVMLATWNLKIYPALAISDAAATGVQVTMRSVHLAVGTLLLANLWLLTVMTGQATRARELARASEAPTAESPGALPSY